MQADRNNGHRPARSDPSALAELQALRETCRVRGHRIDVQDGTIAVLRGGANALTLENAGLRREIARLLARSGSVAEPLVEVELERDQYAPARARAAIAEALRTRVTADELERSVLLASELVNHSVLRTDTPPGGRLCLRAELSLAAVHLELEDPAPSTAFTLRLPEMENLRGLGLAIVHGLTERWGAELAQPGGTRLWAQLTLTGP
jgi:hypothetical protein